MSVESLYFVLKFNSHFILAVIEKTLKLYLKKCMSTFGSFPTTKFLAVAVAQWSWWLAVEPKDLGLIPAVQLHFDGGEVLEAHVLCDLSLH